MLLRVGLGDVFLPSRGVPCERERERKKDIGLQPREEVGSNRRGGIEWRRSQKQTYRRLSFREIDVCVEQHCDVLVSRFQSDGQSVALILQ